MGSFCIGCLSDSPKASETKRRHSKQNCSASFANAHDKSSCLVRKGSYCITWLCSSEAGWIAAKPVLVGTLRQCAFVAFGIAVLDG
jgi:hypothetical protein